MDMYHALSHLPPPPDLEEREPNTSPLMFADLGKVHSEIGRGTLDPPLHLRFPWESALRPVHSAQPCRYCGSERGGSLSPRGSPVSHGDAHSSDFRISYLLGSGGTLIFDLIIMLQSFVYGSAPPIASSILDRGSRRRYDLTRRSVRLEDGRQFSISSERQPLLSGSTPEHPSEQSQQSQSTHHGSLHLRRHSSSRPPDIQEDDDSTVRQE